MKIHFHTYGDRALLIRWEQRIDPAINTDVVRLDRAIAAAKIEGIQFSIPAYCSLTVGFHPDRITYEQLCDQIQSIRSKSSDPVAATPTNRQVEIPVCYEGAFAPDLEWMCQRTGLDPSHIIQLHTGTLFRVYMLGFMPGFPYLGSLPSVLEAPRKETPRLRVPAGSVALAGLQTGIYPIESPGGWQIIGRTPLQVFDPSREEPFLLRAGDEVQFKAIGSDEYEELKNKL
ncbi:5-oxoprolinase subunit PxpB [Flavilitoribacter nigricans]|uniref:Allophanate hydrolase n=1 Tax=Flavilitoribacter nigricans (strain ATCC 23147 / DSM 23189 / NBRC 102662 / NCIMB 1420 / SS-2) TaxID=1122177 RepID=A0A2D0N9W3_FLAN2|nr:5-oxoprolinase subunit PxpB [Flavilitoribacter nigricans]PHN05311.1 allophanate hydrolase [Flavilitoribacter nigricans DSM 23189 = NBRC 102662]